MHNFYYLAKCKFIYIKLKKYFLGGIKMLQKIKINPLIFQIYYIFSIIFCQAEAPAFQRAQVQNYEIGIDK